MIIMQKTIYRIAVSQKYYFPFENKNTDQDTEQLSSTNAHIRLITSSEDVQKLHSYRLKFIEIWTI